MLRYIIYVKHIFTVYTQYSVVEYSDGLYKIVLKNSKKFCTKLQKMQKMSHEVC